MQGDTNIHFIQANNWELLKTALQQTTGKKYVLVDSNTLEDCYPVLLHEVPELKDSEIIEIDPGEDSKDMQICSYIWQTFTEQNAGRDSLLLNLGGGVVSDLGGFVASVYKRGISYIHIPTSLLGMVDASIGGKTGVDFLSFKNQLGVCSSAQHILIWDGFLETLAEDELVSGFAEVLKHALIADKEFWEMLLGKKIHELNWKNVISRAVSVKSKIVEKDPFEGGNRKLLNFGHTLGHGLESFFLSKNEPIRHGEAVAAGMVCATFLSFKINKLPQKEFLEVVTEIDRHFVRLYFQKTDIPTIIRNINQDKKSVGGKNRFVLLASIGKACFDIEIEVEMLEEALLFYLGEDGK